MASHERLEKFLADASRSLNKAACELRDLDFRKDVNIRRIGELITGISLIRNEVYDVRPDLRPGYLTKS